AGAERGGGEVGAPRGAAQGGREGTGQASGGVGAGGIGQGSGAEVGGLRERAGRTGEEGREAGGQHGGYRVAVWTVQGAGAGAQQRGRDGVGIGDGRPAGRALRAGDGAGAGGLLDSRRARLGEAKPGGQRPAAALLAGLPAAQAQEITYKERPACRLI